MPFKIHWEGCCGNAIYSDLHYARPMSYKYDIFISYRRNPETLDWIKQHFKPLLELRVEFELGRKLDIYLDEQTEIGTSWPPAIGAALGESRVLIALWTKNYLASVWCTEELSQMLSRERASKLRSVGKPYGVIFPAFIHDGESFPPDLQHIKPFEIQNCFNVRMARNSPRAEELDAALSANAKAIAASIDKAPQWRKAWSATAAHAFYQKFYQHAAAVQLRVPRFTR
jgi:hypothetical protein